MVRHTRPSTTSLQNTSGEAARLKKTKQQATGTRAGTLTAQYDANGDYNSNKSKQQTTNKQATPSLSNIKTSQYDANQDYQQ